MGGQESMRERGQERAIEDVKMKSLDKCKWRLFCRGHPLEGIPRNKCHHTLDQTNIRRGTQEEISLYVFLFDFLCKGVSNTEWECLRSGFWFGRGCSRKREGGRMSVLALLLHDLNMVCGHMMQYNVCDGISLDRQRVVV